MKMLELISGLQKPQLLSEASSEDNSTNNQSSIVHYPAQRPQINLNLTLENERENDLVKAGRDVQTVIMDRLPTIKDCVLLTSSCYTLWSKHQTYLYHRIVREVANSHEVDSLTYLVDVLEFNPILRANGINYQHLALILSRAKYWLETMVASDPECDWKIAAMKKPSDF